MSGVPAGSHVCNQESLFLGQLLKLISTGLVDSVSFSGNCAKNTFNFKHYDVNFVALYMNGEQTPVILLQPNFENRCCIRE